MEINITSYFNNGDHWNTCNSIANLGNNAAEKTWQKALDQALEWFYVTDENREDLKSYFAGFGAWDDEEIDEWSDQELNALLLQEISSQCNEIENFAELWEGGELNWQAYSDLSNEGIISGKLFQTPDDNKIYIYIGE